ncbi:hypothetical protein F8M41_007637 [Gigaspora margarita]|uniref:Uncharacterized protein n=1 Tax=Gigaspora margarita TaxID=4874 RepID=A0A8H3X4L4_GIGMA|nr:hypothetical protein F8M41_007637 [Gigaspora margarita]
MAIRFLDNKTVQKQRTFNVSSVVQCVVELVQNSNVLSVVQCVVELVQNIVRVGDAATATDLLQICFHLLGDCCPH